jgi:hypothetical protein
LPEIQTTRPEHLQNTPFLKKRLKEYTGNGTNHQRRNTAFQFKNKRENLLN